MKKAILLSLDFDQRKMYEIEKMKGSIYMIPNEYFKQWDILAKDILST